MAQVLKQNVREKIIKASLEEFSKKGYKDASLRNIATKADMTVGNLYRYYSNKEDLLNSLIDPLKKDVETAINHISKQDMNLLPGVFDVKADIEGTINNLSSLNDIFVNAYLNEKYLLNIVLSEKKINTDLIKMFCNIFVSMTKLYFTNENIDTNYDILINCYAVGVVNSMKEALINTNLNEDEIKQLLITIYESYLKMIESNLRNK